MNNRELFLPDFAFGAFRAESAVTRLVHVPPAGPRGIDRVPGGSVTMDIDSALCPADQTLADGVRVSGLGIGATVLKIARFRALVAATGYVTTAERPADTDAAHRQSPRGTGAARTPVVPPRFYGAPPHHTSEAWFARRATSSITATGPPCSLSQRRMARPPVAD
jgi:hypothetical protein